MPKITRFKLEQNKWCFAPLQNIEEKPPFKYCESTEPFPIMSEGTQWSAQSNNEEELPEITRSLWQWSLAELEKIKNSLTNQHLAGLLQKYLELRAGSYDRWKVELNTSERQQLCPPWWLLVALQRPEKKDSLLSKYNTTPQQSFASSKSQGLALMALGCTVGVGVSAIGALAYLAYHFIALASFILLALPLTVDTFFVTPILSSLSCCIDLKGFRDFCTKYLVTLPIEMMNMIVDSVTNPAILGQLIKMPYRQCVQGHSLFSSKPSKVKENFNALVKEIKKENTPLKGCEELSIHIASKTANNDYDTKDMDSKCYDYKA